LNPISVHHRSLRPARKKVTHAEPLANLSPLLPAARPESRRFHPDLLLSA